MKTVLLGSGHVASVLGRMMRAAGIAIIQVFSRQSSHAHRLASELGCDYTDNWGSVRQGADLYIAAVTDDALEEISRQINLRDQPIVHTAGSVPMHVLNGASTQYGVLYPLQSLRREMGPSREIPFLVDGNTESTRSFFMAFAGRISENVQFANDQTRLRLHLAAVVVNNFTNHLYTLTADYCERYGIDFTLLFPLIRETAERVRLAPPGDLQTGPAARNDLGTIRKHLDLLENHPDLRFLYRALTESILSFYGHINRGRAENPGTGDRSSL